MQQVNIVPTVAEASEVVGTINVTIGPQFLNLFSEHLYSSPNKAFEELVSNSWDAGAETVYIGVPKDRSEASACVWVLDNGESMDIEGLRALWAVAKSTKREDPPANGRNQIGKFGIGKLATYLLAHQLTYVCKADDGVIRSVTMDYRRIDEAAETELHIDPIPLEVRQLDEKGLAKLLEDVAFDDEIALLIEEGVPKPKPSSDDEWEDEYGGDDVAPSTEGGTWTLALLTDLKSAGQEMQSGWIRRLLRTALPLGNSISVVFNGESLDSTKVDAEIDREWILGENLGLESITVSDRGSDTSSEFEISETLKPKPHLHIEGLVGKITGSVRLYKDKISGGKSDALGSSNGFLVNIKGRVVNLHHPYFGLENLSHSAWSKFRATVRFDGLDDILAVNREDLSRSHELRIFRAFLRSLFNKARVEHDALIQAAWPNAGDILTGSWNAIPLEALGRVIDEGVNSVAGVPEFIDTSGIDDMDAALDEWQESMSTSPGDLIRKVDFESLQPDAPLVKYNLATRRVVINSNHPFSLEYGETRELQLLLRDSALVDLLTEAHMSDIGIDDDQIRETREYRDQLYRTIAQVNRRSGVQIAAMLLGTTNRDTPFEYAVGDALSYLGFAVQRLGEGGKSDLPEGVATAPIPAEPTPISRDDKIKSYKFTYDAKSSKNGKAKTGNLGISGLARHRDDYDAEHVLVVAPDFEMGALQKECRKNEVTPMRAKDLAELLMLTAAFGPLDLEQFREVLYLCDPDEVHAWVSDLSIERKTARHLSLDLILDALDHIGFEAKNAIHVSVIADRINQITEDQVKPNEKDVRSIVFGLAVVVPSLVRVVPRTGYVFLSTSSDKLRVAVRQQVDALPPEYKFGLDELLNSDNDGAAKK